MRWKVWVFCLCLFCCSIALQKRHKVCQYSFPFPLPFKKPKNLQFIFEQSRPIGCLCRRGHLWLIGNLNWPQLWNSDQFCILSNVVHYFSLIQEYVPQSVPSFVHYFNLNPRICPRAGTLIYPLFQLKSKNMSQSRCPHLSIISNLNPRICPRAGALIYPLLRDSA